MTRVRGNTTAALSVCVMLGIIGVAVAVTAQEEDLQSVSLALAPRAEALIIARCSVCHTSDLIAQQRLPPERWQATVEKMKHWGAELSEEEASLLVRYLSARYHPGAPDNLPPLDSETHKAELFTHEPTAAEGPVTGLASRGGVIFSNNCQACHGAGAIGGMGPKLAKNPILQHEEQFWDTVLHGRGPMPAWGPALSRQDIADIHAWLLTR
jgi:cytochrome c oxidase cbb3-type subunit 3